MDFAEFIVQALSSFSCSDFVEAGNVQQKANDIIELLEDGTRLQQVWSFARTRVL